MARNPLTPFRSGSLPGGDPFLSLHGEMIRLFDAVLCGVGLPAAGGQTGGTNLFAPQRDVSETDNEIRITAELPSVNETDIQVERNDDILVIRGEKKFERNGEREHFHFVERSYAPSSVPPAPPPGGSRSGAGELRKRRSHRHPAQERSSRAVAAHPGAGRTRPEWG